MDVFPVLAAVFGALAFLSMVAVPFALRGDRKLAREGATTTGTIVALEADPDTGHHARVEFVTQRGRHTFFASTQPGARQVGETVQVRYLPDRPDEARLDQPSRVYGRTILAIVLSVGFSLTAAVMLVLASWQ